ncbi:Tbingi protein, partial [Trypanosoma cruzi]
MDSTERCVVLEMRTATKATVPAWNHQPSPFWNPWLAKFYRAIVTASDAEGSQWLDLRRREALREASKSRWRTLRSIPEFTDDNSRQVVRPCVRPSFLEHSSHEIRWPNAQQTPEGQPPHEAVGGESNTAPKAPPSATDPDECDGPHPISMAEPGRTLRLLLLGPAPGPDGIHGKALRHLGRVARRAVPWLFDSRLCAGAVPRNRRRVAVLLLPNPERTASNRESHRPVTMSSCLSKLMERAP